MQEKDILAKVNELVDREHQLRAKTEAGELDAATERQELKAVEEALDQCWDLLRQRRARKDAGQSAEGAAARPIDEVEHYLQ
ncbi:MAG TPA: DUF2630 family protein [Pseudonocardiaceae bacterium]|jgi:hypothetical protein|nr:DUF2630 family protein [Pseudonocardiaceae bacterium]